MMKQVLVIGSGIAGMSAAITCAENGVKVIMVSPFPSERAQSVMATGGISAALDNMGEGDTVEAHAEDTLKGGCLIGGEAAVKGLCEKAPDIIRWLEKLGTVFTLNSEGKPDQRAFGGHTYKRTCYAGSSTGKQIVSALIMECRRYEAEGMIERRFWHDFHSALIKDGVCHGALLYNEAMNTLEPIYANGVIMATGGQNALFGKTSGSTQCDGYGAGRLFMQGVELKNLEFIQYHPTTMETPQKKMLISEAARGEGGRLYYIADDSSRVYFMEEKYGPKGNLMPRDIVAREIYNRNKDVYLDVSFLGKEKIDARIPEVRDICLKYRGIDISEESIPVVPSVHFFMGGIAVNNSHETNIKNLYAAGECASIYHGANRLGGNGLLAAAYGGIIAGESISRGEGFPTVETGFGEYIQREQQKLQDSMKTESKFPVMYIRNMVEESMWNLLGIVRDEKTLDRGIDELTYYIDIASKVHYDSTVLPYFNYSLEGILTLAKATLVSARSRKESRGAHFRSDFPETKDEYKAATIISYDGGEYNVRLDLQGQYES